MASTELILFPTPSGPSSEALAAAQRLVRAYPALDPDAAVRIVLSGQVIA